MSSDAHADDAGLIEFLRENDNPFDRVVQGRRHTETFDTIHVSSVNSQARNKLAAAIKRYRIGTDAAVTRTTGDLPASGVVVVRGPRGSGKTHLLCAVGQELIRSGRKVCFRTCSLLVQELLIAKRDLKLSKVLKKLASFEALIIDDVGYVQQSREEMEVLFTLLAERYERGSVLLTSNLPFSKWESIFKDPMTTAAAIDRLVHHSVILELNIPSYRLEQAKAAQTRN